MDIYMQKKQSVKDFGEVFTPNKILEKLIDDIEYSNPNIKICEPSFGDGRILLEIKNRLMQFHDEKHIFENMLFGMEIQENLYNQTIELLGAKNYKHNFYCQNALYFNGENNVLQNLINKMDYVIGNPPYNRNLLKKDQITEAFWNPSGYTTKLAYCCFVVMANTILKENGKIRYVIPCSFTHNENTQQFREFLNKNLKIESIEILEKNAFENIMIRTCIFKSTKKQENNIIKLTRIWNNKVYITDTYYNEYMEIPLFIGDLSKKIYEKVMKNNVFPKAYKGWNGVDSYSKYSSKDPSEYPYKYVENVKKNKIILKSSLYKDKIKAKPNNKKNNVGNYDRFDNIKILINEILFNSFEAKNHIKHIIKDKNGKYGSSPLQTVFIFSNISEMEEYVEDLKSKICQMILSVMKDYNHNDSKLFRYIPFGISKIKLNQEEIEFLNNFNETKTSNVYELN